MFNVCHHCGQYRVDKTIDLSGPYAVRPEWGHRFILKPLLVVSGANGAGKSAVCSRLVGCIQDAVLLDSDILWGPAWRGSGDPAFTAGQIQFNQWFKDYQPTSQQPPITTLDTTGPPLEETASQVKAWIQQNLA